MLTGSPTEIERGLHPGIVYIILPKRVTPEPMWRGRRWILVARWRGVSRKWQRKPAWRFAPCVGGILSLTGTATDVPGVFTLSVPVASLRRIPIHWPGVTFCHRARMGNCDPARSDKPVPPAAGRERRRQEGASWEGCPPKTPPYRKSWEELSLRREHVV